MEDHSSAAQLPGTVSGRSEQVLPKALDGLINTNLNDLLKGLVLKKEIDKYATITFYLTDSPNFADDALTLDLSGQVVKT